MRRLPRELPVPLRPFVSALVAVGVGVVSAALVATARGEGLSSALALLAAALGAGGGFVCWRSFGSPHPTVPASRLDLLAALVLVGYAAWQFSFVLYADGLSVLTLTAYNYGDLPLHLSYIANLSRGAPFWPETPILTGASLRYPLGADLLVALLLPTGLSVEWILRICGIGASLCLAVALLAWGRGFAVAAFLFSGGVLGLRFLWTGVLADANSDLAWKNLLLALFIPQRGFLFALPAGLLLLSSFRDRFLREGGRALPRRVEGLLLGTLPLFHLHTFAVVAAVGGVWALRGPWRSGLPTLAVALMPATWSVWQVTEGFRAAKLAWWSGGWMVGESAVPAFLLLNLGIWPLLWLAGGWFAARGGSREERTLLFTGLVGLTLFSFLILAPWEWDNTKVLLWCFLLTVPAVWSLVLARRGFVTKAPVVSLFVLSQGGSLLVAARGTGPRLEVYRKDELEAVCKAVTLLPVTARVATTPTFNHPVALCGQPVVAGYAGHLWSHGYEVQQVEADLTILLDGSDGWREAARRLGSSHVFFGPREAREHPRSTRAWLGTGSVLHRSAFGWLIRIEAAENDVPEVGGARETGSVRQRR